MISRKCFFGSDGAKAPLLIDMVDLKTLELEFCTNEAAPMRCMGEWSIYDQDYGDTMCPKIRKGSVMV